MPETLIGTAGGAYENHAYTQTGNSDMRHAKVSRATSETKIAVKINIDGCGRADIRTGVGFLDHLLDLFARHSLFDLSVRAEGDTHIDDHHTVEDIGIAIGEALSRALGDKKGINRFADICLPMDEALAIIAVDISGRPFLVFEAPLAAGKIGSFDTELVREWFQAFAMSARITLHAQAPRGANKHHIAEALFKALARALRRAVAIDPREEGRVPSTKGTL
jgi:imidazoleglycerol-phosphate dehydratase